MKTNSDRKFPGDLGQTFDSLSTFEHYLQSNGQTVLYVGDLSYADDHKFDNGIRWDTWGRFVEPSTAYQPWIWTSGNHEIEFRQNLGEIFAFLKPFLHCCYVPSKASSNTSLCAIHSTRDLGKERAQVC